MQKDAAAASEVCQHWLLTGQCKFGSECRLLHTPTLARMINAHPHPVGSDTASKRKKFFCDVCGKKGARGYRCVSGCDWDVCVDCFNSADPRAIGEGEGEGEGYASTAAPAPSTTLPAGVGEGSS
jgi:hypothetical protein